MGTGCGGARNAAGAVDIARGGAGGHGLTSCAAGSDALEFGKATFASMRLFFSVGASDGAAIGTVGAGIGANPPASVGLLNEGARGGGPCGVAGGATSGRRGDATGATERNPLGVCLGTCSDARAGAIAITAVCWRPAARATGRGGLGAGFGAVCIGSVIACSARAGLGGGGGSSNDGSAAASAVWRMSSAIVSESERLPGGCSGSIARTSR